MFDQTDSKASKTTVETDEMENKKTIEEINKTKSVFFENSPD